MRELLPQAGLQADELEEAREDLDKVTEQAEKPEPNKNILLKRIGSLKNFLESSATIAVAAPQLIELGKQALAWAQRLFG